MGWHGLNRKSERIFHRRATAAPAGSASRQWFCLLAVLSPRGLRGASIRRSHFSRERWNFMVMINNDVNYSANFYHQIEEQLRKGEIAKHNASEEIIKYCRQE
jgi:hypothetical protein